MSERLRIALEVNGAKVDLQVEPRTLLLEALRDHVGLRGTRSGCETTTCGACTVLLDGRSVKSCTVLAAQARDGAVTTIEALADEGDLHPVQESFKSCHALQCGFCTPGMVMAAVSALEEGRVCDEESARRALKGNLCRCTGYHNIVKALLETAEIRKSRP